MPQIVEPVARWKIALLSILLPGLGHHALGSTRKALAFAVPYLLLLWMMRWMGTTWPRSSVLLLVALLGIVAAATLDAVRIARPGDPFHAPPAGVWAIAAGVVAAGFALARVAPEWPGAAIALAGCALLVVGSVVDRPRWLAPGWLLLGISWAGIAPALPGVGPAATVVGLTGGGAATVVAHRAWTAAPAGGQRAATAVALATVPLAALLSSHGVRLAIDQVFTRVSGAVAGGFLPDLRLFADRFGTTAWDPTRYCHPYRPDPESGVANDFIGTYCAGLPEEEQFRSTFVENDGFLGNLWTYTPAGDEIVTPVVIFGGSEMLAYGALLSTLAVLGGAPRVRWMMPPVLLATGVVLREAFMMVHSAGHVSFWMVTEVLAPAVWLSALAAATVVAFRRPGAVEGLLRVLGAADASDQDDAAPPRTQHL